MTNDSEPVAADDAETKRPLLVAAIGSSAGGIKALRDFFRHLPQQDDLSLIIVQHGGDPDQPLLEEIIGPISRFVVATVEDGLPLEPGHLYVAPPRRKTVIDRARFVVDGEQSLQERPKQIDDLFCSLATAAKGRAIGILLSGAGQDGTVGLKAITEGGGLTMAQDPADAAFAAMPENAIDTGVVDYIGTPQELAQRLKVYVKKALAGRNSLFEAEAVQAQVQEICGILRDKVDQDFQHYKTSTLVRRIQRRMQVLHIDSPDSYVEHLRSDVGEAQALFRELLISVTSFFRDPDAFDALSENVIKPLLADRAGGGEPIRIWVAGCSTGEEAYTLAILMCEAMDGIEEPPEVQIFATDIEERALNTARRGQYAQDIAEEVGEIRLKRFFTRNGRRYQVGREIRDLCTFSLHNLISDPPFSRMDLISCRNVLIYFGAHLQKKLIPVFHYSLKPGGHLFLGSSENAASHSELFRAVHGKNRIVQRKTTPLSFAAPGGPPAQRALSVWQQPNRSRDAEFGTITERIIMEEFAPPYAVVDEEAQIVYLSARIDRYLQPPKGNYSNNITRMARPGLRSTFRHAWTKALKSRKMVIRDDLHMDLGDGWMSVRLTIQPMPELGEDSGLYMVVFEDQGFLNRPKTETAAAGEAESQLEQLEEDLTRTREELERTVQDLEAANEELKSSNEELLSMNEELQSANEELESSKDEIEAGNQALEAANSDLLNLLRSTEIATIFLDSEDRVRSFTPAAGELYNVTSGDIGRPLDHFTHRFVDLPEMPSAEEVKAARDWIENEVASKDGRAFLRRITPYRTANGETVGIVVAFIDVTEQQKTRQKLSSALAELESIYAHAPVGLALIDRNLAFRRINEALAAMNGIDAAEHIDRPLRDIVPNLADQAEELMDRMVSSRTTVGPFELKSTTPSAPDEERTRLETWAPIFDEDGEVAAASISVLDISESMRTGAALRESEAQSRLLRLVVQNSPEFIGVSDKEGRPVFVNDAGLAFVGMTWDEARAKTVRDYFVEDERDYVRDVVLPNVLRDGRWEGELHFRHALTGEAIPVLYNVFRVDDPETSEPINFATITRDLRAQKHADETRHRLIEELNHRVRNTLAIVSSIASQTLRHSDNLDAFARAFEGRIQALAATHTMLADQQWGASTLKVLLRRQLEPYMPGEGAVRLDGPEVALRPKPTVAMSLVFHELATNAAKYGAFTHSGGYVDISWTLSDQQDGEGRVLSVTWRERGGPAVTTPEREGFGSMLIAANIELEFGGRVSRQFERDGLICTLTIPLPRNSVAE